MKQKFDLSTLFASFVWGMNAGICSLLVILGGCSKPESSAPPTGSATTITRESVRTLLTSVGINGTDAIVTSNTFAEVNDQWVFDFSNRLAKEQVAQGVSVYEMPANDCVKFSRFAQVLADRIWFQTPGHGDSDIGVGVILYFRKVDGKPHAINFFIRPGPSLEFYEPQNRAEVQLTAEEKNGAQVIL